MDTRRDRVCGLIFTPISVDGTFTLFVLFGPFQSCASVYGSMMGYLPAQAGFTAFTRSSAVTHSALRVSVLNMMGSSKATHAILVSSFSPASTDTHGIHRHVTYGCTYEPEYAA
jgi:hypothetical protein